jgi:hypothetical protein
MVSICRSVRAPHGWMVTAATGPIPASPKSEGAEHRLNALGAGVLNALRSAAVYARSSAQRIGVRLATDHLDLYTT